MGATISSFLTYRISATNPVDYLEGVPVSYVVPRRQGLVQFSMKGDSAYRQFSGLITWDTHQAEGEYRVKSVLLEKARGDMTLFACSVIHNTQVSQPLRAFHSFFQPALSQQEIALVNELSPQEQAQYKRNHDIIH